MPRPFLLSLGLALLLLTAGPLLARPPSPAPTAPGPVPAAPADRPGRDEFPQPVTPSPPTPVSPGSLPTPAPTAAGTPPISTPSAPILSDRALPAAPALAVTPTSARDPASAEPVRPGDQRPATATPTPVSPSAAGADVGLDPGHSARDVGAVGGGHREFELTLQVAQKARQALQRLGYRVVLTRTDHRPLADDTAPDPITRLRREQEARLRRAGAVRAYVSIHFNSFSDPRLSGTETYYNPTNRGPESRRLAQAVQSAVVARLRATGHPVRDRGVKEDLTAGKPYGHFFSLRGGMPAVLLEALFLSNPTEAALAGQEPIQWAIAQGIAEGVHRFLASPPDR